MRSLALTPAQLTGRLYAAAEAERLSPLFDTACVVLDLRSATRAELAALPARLPNLPVIGLRADGQPRPDCLDVVLGDEQAAASVVGAIEASPLAAMTLVQLLRHNEVAGVADGLFAESLAYSSLQSGERFRTWLAERRASQVQRRLQTEPEELVRVVDDGDLLCLELNRPHKRNAYSAGLRDALVAALQMVLDLDRLGAPPRQVLLRGAGAAFSAGGDLEEFGTAPDGATAHAVRMTRSAALLLHSLRDRVTCELHGACIGAGIELPAFTARIRARRDAFFALPEVGMGLVPGAGGTVSLLRRVGRHRLTWLALTGARIDAPTALSWGLVDELVD